MKMKKIILMLALVTGFGSVCAQSAEEFFNTAANQYVFSKEKLALNTIDQGLSAYPGNKPLTQLKEKILRDKKKKNQNQQQNQQQKKNQQQQKKDQQDQKNQQQKQDQQQQKKSEEQKNKQDQKQKQQAAKDQEDKAKKDKDQKNQMPPKSSEEKLRKLNMSEEKARMILEAMRNNEIQYLQQMRRKATKKPESGKPDW